ncbi:hypothetical protein K7432_001587 [Basidiobolus ranarum]|uniref:Myosin-binding domain-containing protein n=1 Tax=Basidiobolus ranarum TaxID=34480 RepID=A0ABR2W992_9FUNG
MSELYDEGEIVTYEDTPFAEYLASIESKETVVRAIDLPDRQAYLGDLMNMTSSWLLQRWSEFAEFSSVTLTPYQFTRFDEDLSHIVKSSYLLADTPLVHYYPLQKKPREKIEVKEAKIGHSTIGLCLFSAAGISLSVPKARSWMKLLINDEYHKWSKPSRKSPWLWLWLATSSLAGVGMTTVWLKRRATKRVIAIQKVALSVLENLIYASQSFDIRIHKSMKMIQEIELVSRGYRLSTILPPISRIEQNSTTYRCLSFRRALYEIINDGILLYRNFTRLVLENTKSTVYEFSNNSNPVENSEDLTLASIKRRFQMLHEVRRFALIEILKIENHLPVHEFVSVWKRLVEQLDNLVETTDRLTVGLSTAHNNEFKVEDVPMMEPSHTNSKETHPKSRGLLQGLAILEQHIRAIQAKLYICSEDIRSAGEDLNKESLSKQYLAVKQDLNNVIYEWEQSYDRLLKNFESPAPECNIKPENDDSMPRESDEVTTSSKVITCDSPSEEHEVSEKVFEAVSGVSEDRKLVEKKLTRAERIRFQKTRREEEEQARLKQREVSMMVDELRDVVKRRKHEKNSDTTTTTSSTNTD